MQLNMHTLVAPTSPKRAFYTIKLLCSDGQYRVEKESGITVPKLTTLDRRVWDFASDVTKAQNFYKSKLRAKMRGHKNGRQYELRLPGFI